MYEAVIFNTNKQLIFTKVFLSYTAARKWVAWVNDGSRRLSLIGEL